MENMRWISQALGAAALVICTAGNGEAASIATLSAGGSLTCGNLTFTNFRGFVSNAHDGADAPSANQVFANPDSANCGTSNPGPGLIFTSPQWNVNGLGGSTTSFTYDVISALPTIRDGSLTLFTYDAQFGGEVHIISSVQGVQNFSIDTLTGGLAPIVDAHVFGATYAFLTVNATITLEGHGANGALADAGLFTQNFSQVPEPSSVMLIGFGLAGIGLGAMRRKQTA